MTRELARAVRDRANDRCEYCLLPQFAFPLIFQIDHIIAEQHGGQTVVENLALACPPCNRYKGPNVAGLEPGSDELVRLFHPRRDSWREHFTFDRAYIAGKTPVGRVTVQVLAMNATDVVLFRAELRAEGFPYLKADL